jgi:two-component system, cell cycle sensor histidine kinase and response regulator CckA
VKTNGKMDRAGFGLAIYQQANPSIGQDSFARKPLRILFVENSDQDIALVLAELGRGGYEPVIEQVMTAEAMRTALDEKTWDIILCDHTLPEFNSWEALRLFKESNLDIPFIIVSGTINEELAAQALRSGAHDYLDKNNLVRLVPTVGRELHQIELRQKHRDAEEAFRKSEAQLRSIVETTPECVKIIDRDGLLVEMNKAGLDMVECDNLGSLKGTCVYPIIAPDYRDAFQELNEKVCQGGRGTLQFELVGLRGTRRTMETHAVPIPGPDGTLCQLAITRDITARLNLEAQLRQAQKMESVGHLAGGIAHDFNNILTVIQGHSTLMLSSETLKPTERDAAQQISLAAERAANLTRQLLTFSRRQIIQTRALDLNEVVGQLSKMLQRLLGEDICLHVNYAATLPPIFADQGMIEQIMMNLAVNSRDAMPKGGHLTINTSTLRVDDAYANQNSDAFVGETVCMTITDTGCGIPEENLSRIFEPFFTTKAVGQGTGLGLATVYGIVKQHSGWMRVQSEVGKGTTFQIYLPCGKGKKMRAEISTEKFTLRGGTETILLVEDEAAVRNLVNQMLQKLGYTVLEADSGVAALKVWKHNREKIHLLLTDMIMPDGMTGRELAEILQFDRPEIKVIFTSGYNAEIVGEDFVLHEGLNFLQKPYQPKKLARVLRECLDNTQVMA